MNTEINVSSENIVTSQSTSVQKDKNENCCGICLTAYKSPRILPCKHIFCRLCLTKLAVKNPVACPLCRKEINLTTGGVDELPIYFEDEDDDDGGEHIGNADASAEDEDEQDLCVVCENSVPAEYECLQCQKVLCDSCKKIHDNLLKHDVHDLKLYLSQDKCIKHPEVKVGYFCLDCDRILCKECVQSEHSLHQTQTLNSYLMEIDGELKDYSSNIEKKLETVEMSKVMFSSNTEGKVLENIENVKILGEDFKIELEKACLWENRNKNEDKKLINRINFMGRKIKKSKKQRKFNQNLILDIKELQAKIKNHKHFYIPNKVDDIIKNQIGMMDVQMGRLFIHEFTLHGNVEFDFFFGNLHWRLSASHKLAPQQACDICISLRPFTKLEDTQLVGSITTTITLFVVAGTEDNTVSREFSKTFRSSKDELKWEFKYYYIVNYGSSVKVLFQNTSIKLRNTVELL